MESFALWHTVDSERADRGLLLPACGKPAPLRVPQVTGEKRRRNEA